MTSLTLTSESAEQFKMPWFLFSLFSAAAESINHLWTKRYLSAVDPLLTACALSFFSLPWLTLLAWGQPLPTFSWKLVGLLIASAACYGIARILFVRAVLAAPLSLTVPINAFTPLFLVVTSWVILDEIPSTLGIFGVLLIVIGSYVLNLSRVGNGWLAPLKALFSEAGPRLMLGVAFLWSLAPNFDKLGAHSMSASMWVLSLNILMSVGTGAFLLTRRTPPRLTIRTTLLFSLSGLLMSGMLFFHVTALTMTLVTYASAVRRVNSVFSVILGVLVLKESNLRERLSGSLLMLLGAAVLSLH